MRNLGEKDAVWKEVLLPKNKFFDMYRKKLKKGYKNTDLSLTFDVLKNVDKICGFDDYERKTKGQAKVQK